MYWQQTQNRLFYLGLYLLFHGYCCLCFAGPDKVKGPYNRKSPCIFLEPGPLSYLIVIIVCGSTGHIYYLLIMVVCVNPTPTGIFWVKIFFWAVVFNILKFT